MTQDEAEKLARDIANAENLSFWYPEILQLANYVLSGDMKREIKNAAYANVVKLVEEGPYGGDGLEIANAIRALIQPPALDETGSVHESCGCVFCDLNVPRQYSTAAQGYMHDTMKGPISCPITSPPPAQKEDGK